MEWLKKRRDQVSAIEQLLMKLQYSGVNVLSMPYDELMQRLVADGLVPAGVEPTRFAAMLKSRAKGGTDPQQDVGRDWKPDDEGIPYNLLDKANELKRRVWGSYKVPQNTAWAV